ncbi:MAG: hypothetical protein WBA74_09785 [Cyclobacteriaceae bacterium]
MFKKILEPYIYVNVISTLENIDTSELNLKVKLFDYMSKKTLIFLHGASSETMVNKKFLKVSPGNVLKVYDLENATTLSEKKKIMLLKLISNIITSRLIRITFLFILLILLALNFFTKVSFLNDFMKLYSQLK